MRNKLEKLIKKLYNVPYKQIGAIFCDRDHSTVLSACEKIENEMTYPGQIKVSVIREYRAIETAK